ncbi:MAG TPA: glucose-6-phosphate isomerase [Gammaproteobacteria bacterium]|nr:glucose-6-phosphate isomerase [Gammaproteobacteria bacterium]
MLTNSKAWRTLLQHQQYLAQSKLIDLFNADSQRFANFSLRFDDMLCDYSKQHVTAETMNLLLDLADEANLTQAIADLFAGALVNKTEQRAALHSELRNPHTTRVEIKQTLEQMQDCVAAIKHSDYTDAIILGIGGSDLGPRLVCEALAPYKTTDLTLHFVSNVDSDTLLPLLQRLNPARTLCLINSKTFTTIETLTNAKIIRVWLGIHSSHNMWAITANPGAAEAFGINASHVFTFWDWVGGRYSIWSAVGLPVALTIGMENFKRLLHGAHMVDQHFATAPLAQNMPVLLGLLGIWNINFRQHATLCIQPYADGLQLLPAYLQQLEMESNGKSVANSGETVNYQTAPVIWGGVGCNGQHAYMQMLHQGTQVVPVDFLVARRAHAQNQELQQVLVASCLGQSQALMSGRTTKESYKACAGNKPSTTIMFDIITPEIIGKIIALYEHKVYVQGVIWQIQSFDQWGVQLGKDLIKDILQVMSGDNAQNVDSSTAGLLDFFLGCPLTTA